MINFYLVAAAITFSAYTSAINGKDYSVAAAIAIAGLAFAAIASLAVLHAINAGARAEPALAELQDRIAARLGLDAIRMTRSETPIQLRRAAIIVTFGLAALINISALLYAATR